MPEHIHHDYPLFVSFTSAYLEYLEETKNPHDIAINLREYRDSDGTLDEFIELFSSEYMVNIPTDVITDKRLLAKHIKKFYLNKGFVILNTKLNGFKCSLVFNFFVNNERSIRG